jgi:hypothetical protein
MSTKTRGSAKDKVRPIITEYETHPEHVRGVMKSAGAQMASVHFYKKNGELRKMAYRLRVSNPTAAAPVKGVVDPAKKKARDLKNKTLTVLDTNKVVRDNDGNIIGRGAWRTVPLDRVVQVTVRGVIHKFQR